MRVWITPLGQHIELVQPWRGKRLVDFLLACFLLALLSPMLFCVSLVVKLTSPGPVFYRDSRLGIAGKVYSMLKFRSMLHNAPPLLTQGGKLIVSKSDPRLTPVGRLLRTLHLDEMPQLLNVIKGDMSFVGPRPGQPAFEHLYTREAYERLRVHPGITGLGAVVGGRFLENASLYAVEAAYVRQQSPMLDLLIVLLTPVYASCGTQIPRVLLARYLKGIQLTELAGEQEH